MSERVLTVLREKFGDAVVETHSSFGDDTAVVAPGRWRDVCRFLREDPQTSFDLIVDLCAVDYAGFDWSAPGVPRDAPHPPERFEGVLHLYSIARRHRLRLKARVGDEEGAGAEIDSVSSIWPGANWFERTTYDLIGITFKGHPDLRRILMYPEFEGHPLRKDYPANKTQPLVPYRTEEEAGLTLEKLPPFGPDEGMPFGRRSVQRGEA
jgi:NADH-quinone oxidoreductase subunit C